jgi:hypothetical protein
MLHKFLKTFLCKLLQHWKNVAVLIFITGIGCSPFSETNRSYIFDFLDNIEQAEMQGQPLESADSHYKTIVTNNSSENVELAGINFFPVHLNKKKEDFSVGVEGIIEASFNFDRASKENSIPQTPELSNEFKTPSSNFQDWSPVNGKWEIKNQTISSSPSQKFAPNNVIFKLLNGIPIYWIPKKMNIALVKTDPSYEGSVNVNILFDETSGTEDWYVDTKSQRKIRGLNHLAGIIYNASAYPLGEKETVDGNAILTNKNGDLFIGTIAHSKLAAIEQLTPALKGLIHPLSNKARQRLSIQFYKHGLSIWLNGIFLKQIKNLPVYLGNIGVFNGTGGKTSFSGFEYSLKSKKPNENNLAGVYFLPKGASRVYSVVLTDEGYLRVGQLGGKPLKTKLVSFPDLSKNTLKVIFNEDYFSVYLNNRRVMEIPNYLINPKIKNRTEKNLNVDQEKIGFLGAFRKGNQISLEQIGYAIAPEQNKELNVKEWDQFEFLKSLLVKRKTKLESNSKYIISKVKSNSTVARALITKAPSTVKFRLKIPQKAFLTFSPKLIGILGEKPKKIKFSIEAYHQELKSELFSETLSYTDSFKQERIDLKDFAGKETEIHFIAESEDDVFALWGSPQILTQRNKDEFNVILISIDTLRADHLSSYGYKPDISPQLNEIVKKGTQFNQAISQAPWTLPSHMSMLTSYYPMALGYRPSQKYIMIPGKVKTLAQKLQKHGYINAGFTGGGYVSSQYGFSRGFSYYEEKRLDDMESILDRVNRWISLYQDDKFFVFFHTFEVHEYKQGENEDENIAFYDKKIKSVDQKIKKLFDFLKRSKLDAKTLVIFTSDHGEGFGEHVWRGHSTSLYDEQVRVPLVFYMPGTIPGNLKIDSQVSLVDILPTVLDFLGLPPEPNLEGKSLRPFFENKLEDRIAFSGATVTEDKASFISLRTNTHKYIEYDFANNTTKDSILKENPAIQLKPSAKTRGYEFYGLKNNPAESGDKKLKYNSQSKEYSEIIKEFRRANQKKWKLMKTPNEEKVELDQSTRQQLQALGYLQ